MRILIVDDNMTNRVMLKALIDNYAQEYNYTFETQEAEDGVDAVFKCDQNDFDMVLMDINMPKMDGIEASKLIRAKYPKMMIIAVSTSDDLEQRREILNNGAEDYISKPVDADIFKSRMKNYISLLEARQQKTSAATVRFINLFSNAIYSRHTTFIFDSEDSLAEFWEFFLLKVRVKSNHLSDIVRIVVAIVEAQMKISPTSKLYIEESDTMQYFTLTNIDVLPQKVIQLILKKNGLDEGYKLSSSKISFELQKATQYDEETFDDMPPQEMETSSQTQEEKKENDPLPEYKRSNELKVFDYIDDDDMYDLEEYIGKLNSIMLVVGYGDVTEEDVVEIYSYLDKISAILSSYSEVYPISIALSELSADMSSHIEEFTKSSEALGPMCKAFATDLSNWLEQSFHTGAPSAEFMNDTIVVNCQTIGGMLKIDETPVDDGDFDDIFDF